MKRSASITLAGLLLAGIGLCIMPIRAIAQTTLNLSATGEADVAPDQITAALTVQAMAPDPAAAQNEVNRKMTDALAMSRALGGVIATTGGYNVYATTPDAPPQKPQYQASQTLQLQLPAPHGAVPDAFTRMIGRLQQDGLLLNSLDGGLSRAGQTAAQHAAITDAIHHLQEQAAVVAATLNLHVGQMQTLSLNMDAPGPVFHGPMAMMKTPAAAPPVVAPGDMTTEAAITATIVLIK